MINWHNHFDYRDGKLYWSYNSHGITMGKEAGGRTIRGHQIGLQGKLYYRSRIIWEKEKIPEGYCITHINGDIFNDKIENLKMIKTSEVNVRRTRKNHFIGVYAINKAYRAEIQVDHQRIVIGTFQSAEEGAKAYDRALIKYGRLDAKSNFPLRSYPEYPININMNTPTKVAKVVPLTLRQERILGDYLEKEFETLNGKPREDILKIIEANLKFPILDTDLSRAEEATDKKLKFVKRFPPDRVVIVARRLIDLMQELQVTPPEQLVKVSKDIAL